MTRADFPLELRTKAHFRYARHVGMDSRGQQTSAGVHWDFTLAGVHTDSQDLELMPIEGQWFASRFEGATFATWASPSDGLLGVYEVTANEILLRGYVSPGNGYYATELHHDPPPRVVRFPIAVGAEWNDSSTVSGKLSGNWWVQLERFAFQVDTEGTADTLEGPTTALRLRTVRTRNYGLNTTVDRTDTFYTPCLGMVARVSSEQNETSEDFSTASEVWSRSP